MYSFNSHHRYLFAFEDYNRKLGPGLTSRVTTRTRRRPYDRWQPQTPPALSRMDRTPPRVREVIKEETAAEAKGSEQGDDDDKESSGVEENVPTPVKKKVGGKFNVCVCI